MIKYIKNQNNGYAILFAVVMVSIISMLAIGLSNSSYKQLVLSLLAKDSQTAFFQADTASECALYADNIMHMTAIYGSWFCGKGLDSNDIPFTISAGSGPDDYELNPTNAGSGPCFKISVTKTGTSPIETTIKSKGYNSCDLGNRRTVEREIEVKY